jgi:hypothetical protein
MTTTFAAGSVMLESGMRVDAWRDEQGVVFYIIDGQTFQAWRNGNGSFIAD